MQNVQFLCLANSRKHSGRCVAGLRLDGLGWVRPVSTLPDGTLFANHYLLDDGAEPRLLDVVEVEVTAAQPEPHQPENWLLAQSRWRLVERLAPKDVLRRLSLAVIATPLLFGTESDRIDYSTLLERPASSSLALVLPRGIRWQIRRSLRGGRQTRCTFHLGGQYYDLSVTDPEFEGRLVELDMGVHPRDVAGISSADRILLTISLGEPLDGICYKLVAAVLVLPGP